MSWISQPQPILAGCHRPLDLGLASYHDVILVSSDDIVFYVPSYHLLSQSNVLRDAMEIGTSHHGDPDTRTSTPIHFTDPIAESAEAISLFLFIASGAAMKHEHASLAGDYPEGLPLAYNEPFIVRRLLGVVSFCVKWECRATMNFLMLWMLEAENDAQYCPTLQHLDLFVLACKAGLDNLAAMVLIHFKPSVVARDESSWTSPWGALAKGEMLTPSSVSFEVWEAVGLEYMCALAKAYQEWEGTHSPDYGDIGNSFRIELQRLKRGEY
ncbi:hypothetical protein IAT38_007775 [Cryptococcus sp. DSM 104549]